MSAKEQLISKVEFIAIAYDKMADQDREIANHYREIAKILKSLSLDECIEVVQQLPIPRK